jgi:hypothetical protein
MIKIRLVGIFVLMLLVANTIPVLGTINDLENNIKTIGERGGLFKQLPYLPENPMPYGLVSDTSMGWQVYEDFWGVVNPICHIHWWGFVVKYENDTWYPSNPEGMIFDVIFFEDSSGEPGNVVFNFEDIAPDFTGTGIMYDYPDEWPDGPFELYHFEADLGLCFELESGWVSIISTSSPSDSVFGWFESPDGNGKIYQNNLEYDTDVSFILAESGDPSLELELKGGLGVTGSFTNIGNETITGATVDLFIYGGMLGKINKHVQITIDELPPGETGSIGKKLLLGFGKISIGLIADDAVHYTSGLQLLLFTKIN